MTRQRLKAAKNAKRDLTLILGMVKRQRQAWVRQGADGYDPREAAQLWASWRLGWRRLTRRNSQVLQLDGLSRVSALLGDVRPRDYATMMRDVNEVYNWLKHLTVQGYNLGVIKGAKMTTAEARFIMNKIRPEIQKAAFVYEQDVKWLLANRDSIPDSQMISRWGHAFKQVAALHALAAQLPDPLPQNYQVRVIRTAKRHVVAAIQKWKDAQLYDAARQLEMAATALRSFNRMMKRQIDGGY